MNFKDLLFLKQDNIYKGRIEFVRAKTGGKLSVKLVPEAQRIIDKYKGEKYLLCFLDNVNMKRKTERYKDITKDTNKLLKKICKSAGMEIKLSTYYARHSFATIGYKLQIPEEVISEMLGHSHGNKMTNIYIERDTTRMDAAQRLIIDALSPN